MNGGRLINVPWPEASGHAVPKIYVDTRTSMDIFRPSGEILFYDDFMFEPWQRWSQAGAGAIYSPLAIFSTNVNNNHPGTMRVDCGAGTTNNINAYAAGDIILIGGGEAYETSIFKGNVPTGTIWRFGIGDSQSSADHTDGIYFEFDISVSSTNIRIVTASNGTRTKTTTSFSISTSQWYRFMFVVNQAASQVDYYATAGGSSYSNIGSITTNIPSGTGRHTSLSFYAEQNQLNGFGYFDVDYIAFRKRTLVR
jgi:hypothetical protein